MTSVCSVRSSVTPTRSTRPTGMDGGMDRSSSAAAVTTRHPAHRRVLVDPSFTSSLPARPEPRAMPRSPSRASCTPKRNDGSVIRRTVDRPPVTRTTRPTSPAAVRTDIPSFTPSPLPRLIEMVASKLVSGPDTTSEVSVGMSEVCLSCSSSFRAAISRLATSASMPGLELVDPIAEALVLVLQVVVAEDAVPGVADRIGHAVGRVPHRIEHLGRALAQALHRSGVTEVQREERDRCENEHEQGEARPTGAPGQCHGDGRR